MFWYEFGLSDEAGGGTAVEFMISRLANAFVFEMLPMSATYAAIGGAIGLGFGMYHRRLVRTQAKVLFLERELDEELPLLIARGESERLEF